MFENLLKVKRYFFIKKKSLNNYLKEKYLFYLKTSWHLLSPFESLFQTHHFLIGQQVMQSYVIQIKRCLAWVCNSFAYKSVLGSNKQLLHVHYLRYDKKTWNLSEWLWRFKWWQLLYWSFNSVHKYFGHSEKIEFTN